MKKSSPRKIKTVVNPVTPPAPGAPALKTADILGRRRTGAPTRPISAKWRWHYGTLQLLQRRLGQDCGDLRRAAAEPLEPHSLDEADSATDEFDHDLALAQLSAEEDALFEVNDALQRIRNGRYGVCEQSGQVIPAARLRAVPWTRFTVRVQERLEKEGAVNRVRLSEATSVRGSKEVSFVPEKEVAETDANAAEAKESEVTTASLVSPAAAPSSQDPVVSRRKTTKRLPKTVQ